MKRRICMILFVFVVIGGMLALSSCSKPENRYPASKDYCITECD